MRWHGTKTKNMTAKQNIKNWYKANYPNDDLGDEINSSASFKTIMGNLKNIYEYIGVYDTLVRERVLQETAKRQEKDYSYIYNKWINS